MTDIKLQILDINEFLRLPISPYRKRTIRADAEEFIVGEAEALSKTFPIHLKLYFSSSEIGHEKDIRVAIQRHFCYRRSQAQKKYRRLKKYGWRILFIALSVLALIFSITELIILLNPGNRVFLFLRESFIILGWVVLWRPLELLLYELYPEKQKINLFRRLENSEVEIMNLGQ